MPVITLLRHAKSDWTHGEADFARRISGRGLDDAPRMGRWIQEQGSPDVVIASPATRAAQTAILASAAWELGADEIIWDRRIYEASLADLVAVLDDYAGDRMIVGHNPGFDQLLGWLVDDPPVGDDGKLMATCTAARLEVDAGPLQRGQGRLLGLQRPRNL